MRVSALRKRYDKSVARAQAASVAVKVALAELQTACAHPLSEVVEGEYRPDPWGNNSTPPFRVCKLCGYAEEGWHCGYWKLGRGVYNGIQSMSRTEAFEYVLGCIVDQEELSRRRFATEASDD